MKNYTYRQLKQFLKKQKTTVTLNINFKYFFSYKLFQHKSVSSHTVFSMYFIKAEYKYTASV